MKYMNRLTKKILMVLLAVTLLVPAVCVSSPMTEVQAASTFKLTVTANSDHDACTKKIYNAIMKGQKIVVTEKYWTYVYKDMVCHGSVFNNLDDYLGFNANTYPDYTSLFDGYVTEKYISDDVTKYTISAKKSAKLAAMSKTAKAGIAAALSSSSSTAELDEAAQSIHNALMEKNNYVIYVKGSDSIKSVRKKLQAKVQKINGQDVIFKYGCNTTTTGIVPGTDDIYAITISQTQAKEYYWMVKLSAKILETAQYYISTYEINTNLCEYEINILAANGMGDLSDLAKLGAVWASSAFAENLSYGVGMIYSTKNGTNTSKTVDLLKALYNGTARGVCSGFASSEVLVFSYWGIDVNYKHSSTHAWTAGTVTDAYGETYDYIFNYCLGKGVGASGSHTADQSEEYMKVSDM